MRSVLHHTRRAVPPTVVNHAFSHCVEGPWSSLHKTIGLFSICYEAPDTVGPSRPAVDFLYWRSTISRGWTRISGEFDVTHDNREYHTLYWFKICTYLATLYPWPYSGLAILILCVENVLLCWDSGAILDTRPSISYYFVFYPRPVWDWSSLFLRVQCLSNYFSRVALLWSARLATCLVY